MDNPETLPTLVTIHRTKTNKAQKHNTTQYKKPKQKNNTDPNKNRGWTQVLAKGKQFLPLIRHPPFYLYSQDVLDTTMHKQDK